MNNSVKLIALLILLAICGIIYLLVFGFVKSERNLYFGLAVNELPTTEKIEELTNQLDLKPQIIEFSLNWPSKIEMTNVEFPTQQVTNLWKAGIVSCVTWKPTYVEDGKESPISFNEIKEGVYDAYLIKFTEAIGPLNFPLIIRFAPDMNVRAWDMESKDKQSSNAELYKEVTQYLVNFFREQRATNALWAFSPYSDSKSKVSEYYPGNAYIDILGMDGFNSQSNDPSVWRGFNQVFEPVYREFKNMASSKPIMVFETATVERGQDRKAWILEALETARAWNISAIIWSGQNTEEKIDNLDQEIRRRFTQQPTVQSWAQGLLKNR